MKLRKLMKAAGCIALAVAVAAGCCSCGPENRSKDKQGKTVISVGGWPQKKGEYRDKMNAKKARFEKANPDVVIEGSSWVFDRKSFYAKAAGGQLPTLYNVGFTEINEIIASDYAADLTDVLEERGYNGMINQALLESISDSKGRIMAFPYNAYILGLAYNSEMMKKAGLVEADGTPKQPKDWFELAEYAKKIKKATGEAGLVLPTANNYGGWLFMPIAWSFGVEFAKKQDNGKWKATFDTPEAVEALQYIKDLKWKYDVLPSNTLIDGTEHTKLFATGKAGMAIAGSSIADSVTSYGMNPANLGMMAIPRGPKRHVTLLGGAVYVVKNGSDKKQIDAAIRWVETSFNYKVTDEFKKSNEDKLNTQWIPSNRQIGLKNMSIWSKNSDSFKWENDFIDQHANVDYNQVKLYNDFVTECPCEVQLEVPVCAQELYGILDGCIQEVLTNKDADCKKLIKGAVKDYQSNNLDKVSY